MLEYLELKQVRELLRLPFRGSLDLTYRCNNNCRHCWLRISPGSPERQKELTIDEIIGIVNDARKMGCRQWFISGGEPMLRPDFSEIFDYITIRTTYYSLNTNGTLITPRIAQLLKRKGFKMVALYGATAEVHDHITRNPGSFEAAMRGFAYLKEAGADFVVQVIPMRDNYHQYDDMIQLAQSLSRNCRIGAPWLYLSACGDPEKNREIICQRLDPKDVIDLDNPDLTYDEIIEKEENHIYRSESGDDRLFAGCIASRRDFHIDPEGQMTFCCFIKDPDLRYDLRKGTFKECWDEFIPSLADKIRGGKEYLDNCGSCDSRKNCRWCPVYGYLEHRKFSAKVEYLCAVANENRKFKEEWKKSHRRYYKIAEVTVQVDSDLPITDTTFQPGFKPFLVNEPGDDVVIIQHQFSLPDIDRFDLGKEVYRKPPWVIYKKGDSWIYMGIFATLGDGEVSKDKETPYQIAVFSDDHTRARIYNASEDVFRKGGSQSLALFPTDQIFLARILAEREACYIHSSGVIFEDKGLLFVGHSDAGKSTMMRILRDKAEILCDDRMIVRRWPEGFKIHASWSHGDVPDTSITPAFLSAIMFLEQTQENALIPIDDVRERIRRLLSCLIKPLVTADWWDKMLILVEKIAHEVPCYNLQFDKSGRVVELLNQL